MRDDINRYSIAHLSVRIFCPLKPSAVILTNSWNFAIVFERFKLIIEN